MISFKCFKITFKCFKITFKSFIITFKCFKITLRDTNMCVGTYLGSLVLSETLSYSYQNIFFTRQNWLFTLAIKLILKKQEKKYASELTLFQFHFHWMFFFSELFVFLVSNEICNTFQSLQDFYLMQMNGMQMPTISYPQVQTKCKTAAWLCQQTHASTN